MEQEKGYKSMKVQFQQEQLGIMMDAQLMYYGEGCSKMAEWDFSIFESTTQEFIYRGSLRETIELILLGKLTKENLEALAKQPATLMNFYTRLQ